MTEPRVIIPKESRGRPTQLAVFNDNGEVCRVDVTGRELLLASQLIDAYRMDHPETPRES